MRQVVFTRAAEKALRRIPANTANTILSKIKQYAADPKSLANNVKKLRGRRGLRLRVGDWRIIFDDDGTVLAILDIGPRSGIYD